MARTTGILPISANFEPRAAEPFDSRSRVETLADLSLFETWDSGDDNAYTYPGMIVSVYADSTPENNGLYYLSAADYTDINNWVKISETLRPQITEDTTIYIDNVDGSNETGDGTESNPYESLEYALKRFEYYILPYKLVFILVNNGVDNPHIVDMTEVKISLATITGAAANANTNIQIVGSLAEITDTFEISRGVEVIYEYTTTYTTTEENELRSYMLSSNGLTPIGQIVESGTDGSLVINSTTADLTGTYYLLKPTSFESANHLNGDFELNVADDSFLVNLKWLDIQWNLERTSNIRLYANYVRFRNESGYSIRNLDTREQSEVRLSFVIFEQFRLNLYKSLACTNTTFIGDNTTADGTGLVTGGGENFGGTMMFIDCLYAIRATGNIGLGDYNTTLTGMYFKNNTHIFMISNEGANIHLKPYSNVVGQFSFRGVQNFVFSNALKPNTTISFSTELYGDLPTNIPTPYIDLEKNIQLRIPGITETDTRRLLPQNYQTVAEVKLLTSDYQFVFCEETGLLYHYETNFDEIVDGVNILNTADGGTTRFVNISGMSAISGLQDALNSKANTNHTHLSANITDLTDAIDENENVSANTAYRNVGHIPIAEKGTAFGVAELDGDGVVPQSQLPPIEIDLKIVTSSAELYAALALDGDRIIQLNYSGNFLFVGAATCVLGSGTKTITGSHKIIFANENIFSASAANTMILFDCKCMMNGGVELTQTGSYDITLSFKDCKTASSNIGNVTVNSDVTAYVANSKEIEWFNGGGTLTFNDEFFISSNLMLVKENVTADIAETDWFPEGYLLESIIVEETAGHSASSLKIAVSTRSSCPNIINSSSVSANYTSILTMSDSSYLLGTKIYERLTYVPYFYSGYRDLLIQASLWNSASFTFKFNLKRV